MSKNISDLRDKLFETIDSLTSKVDPMEIDRAHAVVAVASEIIESAKVEVQAMKIAGSAGTGFVTPLAQLALDAKPPPRGHERLSAVGRK